MDTIDTFLDAMFAPYPSTPRLLEAKGELRAMMEYHKQHYPDSNIEFTTLDPGDFSLALEKFVISKQIGLIVVNTYRRSLFARFFNPGMARRMLFHAGTPLLVMHSNSWR